VKIFLKYSFLLLILSLILILLSFIFFPHSSNDIIQPDIIWLIFSFVFTAEISLLIFLTGQTKDNKSQVFYTLTSISLKFLIELIIAMIWFLIAKKTSISYILLFFVLYLTFTTFSIFVILNTLKNKSL
jgi:hypothetical protein